jgi:cyclase
MRRLRSFVFATLSLALAAPLVLKDCAAQNFDTIQVRTVPVAAGVYMLQGAGGNIGISAGPDGVFMIDDEYAPLTTKIVAAIGAISPAPIRFLINTHWHGDHTGGNENHGKAGVLIVAHENVRHRLSVDQFIAAFNRQEKAQPPVALPVVTFTDTVTFYLNGDSIVVFHVAPAHTDGDAIIYFRHANVIHAGDTYFNGRYPLVDLSSGGSINGMIEAADRMLATANADTKIIPGHGALSNRAELQVYRNMLATVRDRIRTSIAAGKTLEQVQASKPTAEFDAVWGRGTFTGERWVSILYEDLSRK